LLFKFELEFHQFGTDNSQHRLVRSPMLCYDYCYDYRYDVTSELWSHKSEQNCLCYIVGVQSKCKYR